MLCPRRRLVQKFTAATLRTVQDCPYICHGRTPSYLCAACPKTIKCEHRPSPSGRRLPYCCDNATDMTVSFRCVRYATDDLMALPYPYTIRLERGSTREPGPKVGVFPCRRCATAPAVSGAGEPSMIVTAMMIHLPGLCDACLHSHHNLPGFSAQTQPFLFNGTSFRWRVTLLFWKRETYTGGGTGRQGAFRSSI